MIMSEHPNATTVAEVSHVKEEKRPFSFKDEF